MNNFLRKNKAVLRLGAIFAVLFVGLIFFGIGYQRCYMIKVSQENLQTWANEKAAQVNIFLEFQKEKLSIIASINVFKEAVLYPNDPAKIVTAKNRINELKSIIPGISIITNEGVVLVGEIDPSEIKIKGQSYFAMEEKGIIIKYYYCEHEKKDFYVVAGPIYDSMAKNKVIGIVAFDVELDKISALMKETLESETNEVYLIDETSLLLSGSEYIGQGNKRGVLIQEVESEEAKECLADLKKYVEGGFVEEHKEEIPSYLNYMGNEVYGTHAYVTTIRGCVIAEKNSDEVLKFSIWDYIKNIFNK